MVSTQQKSREIIQGRDQVKMIVDNFYSKVQKDDLLGPIFNDQAKVDWQKHLPKMYNFWSDLLFAEDTYYGRPFPPHIPLNLKLEHFERWLTLFIQTVDENFYGLKAEEIKQRATNIATNFYSRIQSLKN